MWGMLGSLTEMWLKPDAAVINILNLETHRAGTQNLLLLFFYGDSPDVGPVSILHG